ncbi:MAG: 16S rRNA (guanine(527)-N(7))-methyltransferase RsmG [Gammaproteobacteria bacterium]|jgi:16S rRNA (guanine527-N7)-methyltransferase|nr:16S rRNA (guanine(527)-N(7))-methyltransferase RsmG [Gammaproteobacteria bacterium]|tara:strand:- start:1060 stop:1701 length:642 start_codon:yes stop_codon:yes gene_type:complete
MKVADLIQTGLDHFSFTFGDDVVSKSTAFIEQLCRWNQVYNLTAVQAPEKMVVQHLLDSLSIAPFIGGSSIIDVGSGAGLPGIPLAILYPAKNFILLDSNGKKTRFMTQAVIDLELENVAVVQERVEQYQGKKFDHVLCRAFASLETIADSVSHLLRTQGNVLAMKGKQDHDTELGLDACLQVSRVIPIEVPLLGAERCLVELKYRETRVSRG